MTFRKSLLALVAAAGTLASPAAAAPVLTPSAPDAVRLVRVQGESDGYENWLRNNRRPDSPFVQGRRAWREQGPTGNFGPYYRGYRGYSDYRPGYKRYNGWWYPGAAFIAGGIIIEGARRADRGDRLTAAHVEWCQDRYRSYRVRDDSFQPIDGPRRRCNSPFD